MKLLQSFGVILGLMTIVGLTIRGTGKVYVSSRKLPKLWVVDQGTLKVLGEIDLPGGQGHQMAVVE